MKLDFETTFVLRLTAQEMRLITAALRGTLKDEQLEEAKELQARIMAAKVAGIKSQIYEVEKLEKNMEKA